MITSLDRQACDVFDRLSELGEKRRRLPDRSWSEHFGTAPQKIEMISFVCWPCSARTATHPFSLLDARTYVKFNFRLLNHIRVCFITIDTFAGGWRHGHKR